MEETATEAVVPTQEKAELLLVKAETKLTAKTKQNEQLETDVWQRMQGHWQSKA